MPVLLLLPLLVALAGDPATYRPPVVPTPMPAEVLPSPYESQLAVPAVDVPTRVALTSEVASDSVGLSAAAGAAKAVALQLAADPRWRVVDWDGARVAYQRVADGEDWTVPLRGYHAGPEGVWRVAVVLAPWAPTSVWATSPLVGRAPASSPKVAVSQISYVGNADWRAVAWEWGDPGATLSVFEAGPRAALNGLPHTNEAVSTVPNFLGRLASFAADIEAKGSLARILPGKPRTGDPIAKIVSPAAGELDVRAWVRTPGRGVSWARILDGDLAPWEEAAVAAGTREILGTSENPKQLFYLQGRFPVPAGPGFTGTIEVWHQPEGSTEVTRIAAVPVTVPAR